MTKDASKLVLLSLWIALGCSESEVTSKDKKYPLPPPTEAAKEGAPGAADAVQGQPSQSGAASQAVLPGAPAQEAERPEGTGPANTDDGNPRGSGSPPERPVSTPAQSPAESSTPVPPPPPEPPLPPSKLGWNGVQLIGNAQFYFLPLD